MLSDQSDAFVDDGFEAKCQFNNAHFILSGDSDNLLVRASRRGRTESVRYLLMSILFYSRKYQILST